MPESVPARACTCFALWAAEEWGPGAAGEYYSSALAEILRYTYIFTIIRNIFCLNVV